jgi:hypothetical protein
VGLVLDKEPAQALEHRGLRPARLHRRNRR